MKLRRSLLALPFVFALASCATSPGDPPPRPPAVDETAQTYNEDLRWGRYYEASARLAPEHRKAFLALLDDDAHPYRFTSVDLLEATPSEDGARVDMLVALEFYHLPSVHEQKVEQRQTWRYDRTAQRWVVEPDLTVLGGPSSAGGAQVPAAPAR